MRGSTWAMFSSKLAIAFVHTLLRNISSLSGAESWNLSNSVKESVMNFWGLSFDLAGIVIANSTPDIVACNPDCSVASQSSIPKVVYTIGRLTPFRLAATSMASMMPAIISGVMAICSV